MPTIQTTDLADLVAGTLKNLGPPKFQQIAQSYQHYEVFPRWFKEDKEQLDGGTQIQRNLMTKLSSAASHTGLFDTDQSNIPDLMVQMTVPWRYVKSSWSFHYTETILQSGRHVVFNIMKPRRADAMLGLVDELEEKAWAAPAVANTVDPYGIPYYVVTNASTGFNGGFPSDP